MGALETFPDLSGLKLFAAADQLPMVSGHFLTLNISTVFSSTPADSMSLPKGF